MILCVSFSIFKLLISVLIESTGKSTGKLGEVVILVVVSLVSLLPVEIKVGPFGADEILLDDEVDDFVVLVVDNVTMDSIDDEVGDFFDEVIMDFADDMDIVEVRLEDVEVAEDVDVLEDVDVAEDLDVLEDVDVVDNVDLVEDIDVVDDVDVVGDLDVVGETVDKNVPDAVEAIEGFVKDNEEVDILADIKVVAVVVDVAVDVVRVLSVILSVIVVISVIVGACVTILLALKRPASNIESDESVELLTVPVSSEEVF